MEIITSWEQQGKEKAIKEIALRLLQHDYPIEQIADLTELSIEQIQQLRSQIQP